MYVGFFDPMINLQTQIKKLTILKKKICEKNSKARKTDELCQDRSPLQSNPTILGGFEESVHQLIQRSLPLIEKFRMMIAKHSMLLPLH